MFSPRSYLLIFVLLIAYPALSQDTTTRGVSIRKDPTPVIKGKTYAIIVGISKYQHFPSLSYADKDAAEFYNFLRSSTGGNIDSNNIKMLLNDEAKALNIGRVLKWLENNAKNEGDQAYIYFAGHGDAANAQEAFLLANDTYNEGNPALYSMSNAFQIYNLKMAIQRLTAKKVKVFLITDACRTNELPGKEKGMQLAYGTITEQNKGEIQMTSCSQDEQSIEDARWGNGRGVFSYYLINGLYGMADVDPEDNQVTFYELERYVRDNVRKETVSLSNKKPRQTPVFRYEQQDEALVKVDPKLKEIISKKIYEKNSANSFATRSNLHFADSIQQSIYLQLQSALKERNLIKPADRSAVHYLNKLLPLITDENKRTDLQDMVLSELINTAQMSINRYTHPPREDSTSEQNADFFRESSEYLLAAQDYLNENEELKKQVMAKRLFLEATAIAEGSTKIDDLDEGVLKADSSLKFLNSSYTYNTLGLLLFKSERYSLAKQHLLTAARLAPQWPYPLINLGNFYRYLYQNDSALYYHKKALELNLSNKNAYYNIGVDYYYTLQYDSAISYLKKAVALNKSYVNAYNYIGIAYINKKQYDSAKVYLQRVNQLDPNYEIAYYNLGLVYENMNMMDSAISSYKKTIQLYPEYANAYTNLGLLYIGNKQYDEATAVIRRGLSYNPEDTYLNNNLGLTFYNKGNYDSALVYFKRSFALNQSFSIAASNAGLTFEDKGIYDSAVYYLKLAIKLDPTNKTAIERLGDTYYDMKEYETALPYYQWIYRLQPTRAILPHFIGKIFYFRSNNDSALHYFEQALTINPKYSDALYYTGLIRTDQGKYNEAINSLTSAVTISPSYKNGWLQLGNAYYYLSKYDTAIACYRKEIAINPTNSDAISNIGLVYFNKDRYDSAIYYYRKAIATNDKSYVALVNIADAFYYSEAYDSAMIYYLKAEQIRALSASEYYKVGAIYYDNGAYTTAIYYLRKSIELNPEYYLAAYYLGRSYYNEKFYESSVTYLKTALENIPKEKARTSSFAHYYLGQNYYSLGMYDSAFVSYKRAVAIDSLNYSAWLAIGYVYEKRFYNIETALVFYQKSFSQYEKGSNTAYYIASAYAQLMNTDSTLQYLELALKNGYDDFAEIKSNKYLNFIRKHFRYKELMTLYKKD
jgi:tetratricopeptide (TPR) repeat protein